MIIIEKTHVDDLPLCVEHHKEYCIVRKWNGKTFTVYKHIRQWRKALKKYRRIETRVLNHLADYIAKAGWTTTDVQTWLNTPNNDLPYFRSPKSMFNFQWIERLENRIAGALPSLPVAVEANHELSIEQGDKPEGDSCEQV